MALNEKLRRLLDGTGVPYEVVAHSLAFTAQEVAAATHLRGREVAKVVVVRDSEDRYLMVVLPAPYRLDLIALAEVTGRTGLRLATEKKILEVFTDSEAGAMPPFGDFYGLPLFVDPCFARHRDFFFQGGNHREVVGMAYSDYDRLARPTVGRRCLHPVDVRKTA